MTEEERFRALRESIEALSEQVRVNHDSLHANIAELFESMQRREVEIVQLLTASRQDAENIRALARIAEIHERRISGLEEQP